MKSIIKSLMKTSSQAEDAAKTLKEYSCIYLWYYASSRHFM